MNSKAPAIRVQNLSKQYRLGASSRTYKTLRESIQGAAAAPWRRLRSGVRPTPAPTFWALQNVCFDVKSGEVVGIVGRNGAGKSTLLKVLSRITEPTEGRAEVCGRVASLLEVGTGFHPELTGRENVFLNGSLLGMKRTETTRTFGSIVEFADLAKFIDTPVKHYSSGMYMRLAFAVAAHLQPEILLVDEVLAVGDVEFQKKCIGKMEEVAEEGRTVLIVSHSMSMIQALCDRAVLLNKGRVESVGSADQIVKEYLSQHQSHQAEHIITDDDYTYRTDKLDVLKVRLLDPVAGGFRVYWLQPIRLAIDVRVHQPLAEVSFGLGIRALDGTHLFHVHHDDEGEQRLWDLSPGDYTFEVTIRNFLRPGNYRLHLGADHQRLMTRLIVQMDPVVLEVLDHCEDGTVVRAENTGLVNGESLWRAPQKVVLS